MRHGAPSTVAAGSLGPELDASGCVSALRAWREADILINVDFQGVFGCDLVVMERGAEVNDGLAARLPLTLAAHGTDVSVEVAVSSASLHVVSEIIYGSVMDASAMADIVRELANIAAGAFKRVADTEGWAMTMGLPTEPPPAERAARPPGMSREFWCRVAGTSAEVHCRLFVTPKVLEHLPPAELTEGMVLAQDVLSDQGTLLFPSGTRLSETTILRLHQLLPATSVIEIARAA